MSPFVLHVNGTTGIDGAMSEEFSVYPRPLHSRLYVSGDIANIKSIQVLSTDGAVNVSQTGYPDEGIDVSGLLSGVYVVAIIQNNGKVYYEKVIKAQN